VGGIGKLETNTDIISGWEMTDYQTIKISPNLALSVIPPRGFVLSDHQKIEIETLWRREQEVRLTNLFNGQLFNLIEINGDKLIGEFVEYKYYLAQLRNPGFVEILHILPICMSGITLAGNKILIGQRSTNVTQYPGYYETVPSGGIDSSSTVDGTIDLKRQFEKELWEETRISVTEIKKIELFSLIFDPENNLYELCGEIQVNYSSLRESLEPSEEYSKFLWLTKQELKYHIESYSSQYVPFSLHLLKTRLKINF
jgi:hypothetical protein